MKRTPFFSPSNVSADNTKKYLEWTKKQHERSLGIVSALPERKTVPTFFKTDGRKQSSEVDEYATAAGQNLCQYVRGNKKFTLDQIFAQICSSSYTHPTSERRTLVSLDLKTIFTQLELTFDELYFLTVSAILKGSMNAISDIFHTCLPLLKERASEENSEEKMKQFETLNRNASLCRHARIRKEIDKIKFDLTLFRSDFSNQGSLTERQFYSDSADIGLSKEILESFFNFAQQRESFKDFLIFLRDFSSSHSAFLKDERNNPYYTVFLAIHSYFDSPFQFRSFPSNYKLDPQTRDLFQLDSMKNSLSSIVPSYGAVNLIQSKLLEFLPFEEIPMQLSEEEKRIFEEFSERAKEIMQSAKKEQEVTVPTVPTQGCRIL